MLSSSTPQLPHRMIASMQISDEELRRLLARAEEIQRGSRAGPAWNSELAAVIGAAEEVGIERHAVELAIAERFNVAVAAPAAGDMVWARSVDGKFYAAKVLSASGESARVEFLGGSERSVTPADVRPCALVPGERIVCNWPWWGRWTCTLVKYDPEKQRVKLEDGWGDSKWFKLEQVWLAPERAEPEITTRRMIYLKLLGAGAAIGAVAGAIVTAIVI